MLRRAWKGCRNRCCYPVLPSACLAASVSVTSTSSTCARYPRLNGCGEVLMTDIKRLLVLLTPDIQRDWGIIVSHRWGDIDIGSARVGLECSTCILHL